MDGLPNIMEHNEVLKSRLSFSETSIQELEVHNAAARDDVLWLKIARNSNYVESLRAEKEELLDRLDATSHDYNAYLRELQFDFDLPTVTTLEQYHEATKAKYAI